MDHLGGRPRGQVAGLHPRPGAGCGGVDEDHAAGERTPSVPLTSTVSPSTNRPRRHDARGQQRLPFDERPAGAVVDDDRPGRVGGEGDPQLAPRAAPVRLEPRARLGSPAAAAASTRGAALAITVGTPDHEAMRAASSLLAMPPLLRPLPPRRRRSTAAGRRPTRPISSASASPAGRRCTARRDRSAARAGRRRCCATPGRRGGRCRRSGSRRRRWRRSR